MQIGADWVATSLAVTLSMALKINPHRSTSDLQAEQADWVEKALAVVCLIRG